MRYSIGAVLLFVLGSVQATERTWDPAAPGCGDATFDVAGCWEDSLLPGDTDRALLDSGLSYSISWDGTTFADWQVQTGSSFSTVTSDSMYVSKGNLTLSSVSGTPYTYRILNDVLVLGGGTLNIGAPGKPMILKKAQNQVSNIAVIYDGRINVTGAGSQLHTYNVLSIGQSATNSGSVSVTDGGSVTTGSAGISSGAVTVDGAGSIFTGFGPAVGSSGTGTLTITNGGRVVGGNWVGLSAGAVGMVTVDGAGSTWTSGGVIVGYSGTGTLNVINGGNVDGATGSISKEAGSTGIVTVDGTDSTWTVTNAINVGQEGTGTLTITNGGSVVVYGSVGTSIGQSINSVGEITVDGAGSTLISDNVDVGESGTGILNIINGGSVSSSAGEISTTGGFSGAVTVDGAGSTWTLSDDLRVYENGSLDITNDGTVIVDGLTLRAGSGTVNLAGGTLDANSIVDYSGLFNFTGGVLKTNYFQSDLLNQGGLLSFGYSPISLSTVTGDYTQQAPATLLIEIDGYTPDTEYDVLKVYRHASLDGSLDIALNPALTISEGDTFEIVQAESISGQFAGIGHRCISETLRWDVIYNQDPAGTDTVELRASQVPATDTCITAVEIDVDPWSAANTVKPDSNDLIYLAVLGSNTATGDATDFDVYQVDPGSLKLGSGEASNIALNPLYGDYDNDTNTDAAFIFRTQGTGILCDDPDVTLQGETFGGVPFEGTGDITTTDCDSAGCHP